jgi:hypothetical protein
VEAREERLTSEAGAVLLREVDERLGLTRWLGERLEDTSGFKAARNCFVFSSIFAFRRHLLIQEPLRRDAQCREDPLG